MRDPAATLAGSFVADSALAERFADPVEAVTAVEGSARRPRHLLHSALEFLLVGGGTLLLLPLLWACRAGLGLDEAELLIGAFGFHAASLINDPHFSVTYLLFYKDAKHRALGNVYGPAQRARYWAAGVVAPLLLVAWAGAALASASAHALGLLIQLMFLLVGWHYVKQAFGVLIVLSSRRGVSFTRYERRLVLAHCFAAWAYAWASPYDAGTKSVVNGVFYQTLPHPPGLELVAASAFGVSALLLLGSLVQKRRREARWPPLAALSGLLISVWVWTVFSRIDPLLAYLIPALHSLQYLYFVWLLTRNAAREAEGPPAFKGSVQRQLVLLSGSALALGWLLLRGLPAWLDEALVLTDESGLSAPAAIGPTPYLAAFVAVVNLHHYFMDYVIWRRDHPDMRHLASYAE